MTAASGVTEVAQVQGAKGDTGMRCPFCKEDDSRVVDSRTADDGAAIRRRRECASCGRRFTTAETSVLLVAKRSGVVEPFSRGKVVSGVRKACQGRPVSDDELALLPGEPPLPPARAKPPSPAPKPNKLNDGPDATAGIVVVLTIDA